MTMSLNVIELESEEAQATEYSDQTGKQDEEPDKDDCGLPSRETPSRDSDFVELTLSMVSDLGQFEIVSNKRLNTDNLNDRLPTKENKLKSSRNLDSDTSADKTTAPILSVNVIETGKESSSSGIDFDWIATEIDAYKLTFQLTFNNPVQVSNS